MAELEIHHEAEGAPDPAGQKVGVLAAVLAVGLAIVTIASHRAHTSVVIHQTEANDRWQRYQSTRVKFHSLELGQDLITVLADPKAEATRKVLDKYASEKEHYAKQREEIQAEAREKEREASRAEKQALRYDFGEGLVEIGLVLSSLYFISRKMFFPTIGIIAGVLGAIIAITGLFV